ncbi:MAG: hypothetical protein MHMPM18_002643 [Marteilia pararefringens]
MTRKIGRECLPNLEEACDQSVRKDNSDRYLREGTVLNKSNDIIKDSTKEYLASIGTKKYVSKKVLNILEAYLDYENYMKSQKILCLKTFNLTCEAENFSYSDIPENIYKYLSRRQSVKSKFDSSHDKNEEKDNDDAEVDFQLNFGTYRSSNNQSNIFVFETKMHFSIIKH